MVIFVNRENPDAILTRDSNETPDSVFAGMDINTTLEISDDAVFKVVLDEKTQDMLQASGNASLNLDIDPNQDIALVSFFLYLFVVLGHRNSSDHSQIIGAKRGIRLQIRRAGKRSGNLGHPKSGTT